MTTLEQSLLSDEIRDRYQKALRQMEAQQTMLVHARNRRLKSMKRKLVGQEKKKKKKKVAQRRKIKPKTSRESKKTKKIKIEDLNHQRNPTNTEVPSTSPLNESSPTTSNTSTATSPSNSLEVKENVSFNEPGFIISDNMEAQISKVMDIENTSAEVDEGMHMTHSPSVVVIACLSQIEPKSKSSTRREIYDFPDTHDYVLRFVCDFDRFKGTTLSLCGLTFTLVASNILEACDRRRKGLDEHHKIVVTNMVETNTQQPASLSKYKPLIKDICRWIHAYSKCVMFSCMEKNPDSEKVLVELGAKRQCDPKYHSQENNQENSSTDFFRLTPEEEEDDCNGCWLICKDRTKCHCDEVIYKVVRI
jgi:hypothetical protein